MSKTHSTLVFALAGCMLAAFFALGDDHSKSAVRLVGVGNMRVTSFSADAVNPAFHDRQMRPIGRT
jgi:hypothetical protein